MPTTNPVPSTDPTDLIFNAQKLDQVVNGSAQYYTDRLGVNRRTLSALEAEFPNAAANAATATTQAGIATTQAGIATTQAGIATTQAGLAAAAKAAAETARDAAFVNANVYADTASGLAATTSGQVFLVSSTADPQVFTVYSNNAGAAALIGSLNIANGSFDPVELSNQDLAYVFADKDGNIISSISSDGIVVADDFETKDGNKLSDLATVQDLQISSQDLIYAISDAAGEIVFGVTKAGELIGPAVNFIATDSTSLDLIAASASRPSYAVQNYILQKAELKKAENSFPLKVDVLLSAFGSDGSFSQRIAGFEFVSQTRMIVVFEQLKTNGNDGKNVRLTKKFVDFDANFNVTEVGVNQSMFEPSNTDEAFVHPHLHKIRYGANKGRIYLFYNRSQYTTGLPRLLEVYQSFSDDNGLTFSSPVLISTNSSSTLLATLPGNGSVVEFPYGPYKNRLVIPVYSNGQIQLLYSDNEGQSWLGSNQLTSSDFGLASGNITEFSVALKSDGGLLMAVRTDLPSQGRLLFAESSNGGQSISVKTGVTPDIIGPNVNNGMVQWAPDVSDGTPKIAVMFARGTDPLDLSGYSDRSNGRLRLSYDNGSTFPIEYSPFANGAGFGYNCLKPFDEQTLFCVYEKPTGETSNASESIRLLIVNLREVIENGTGFIQ